MKKKKFRQACRERATKKGKADRKDSRDAEWLVGVVIEQLLSLSFHIVLAYTVYQPTFSHIQ